MSRLDWKEEYDGKPLYSWVLDKREDGLTRSETAEWINDRFELGVEDHNVAYVENNYADQDEATELVSVDVNETDPDMLKRIEAKLEEARATLKEVRDLEQRRKDVVTQINSALRA